LFDPFGGREIRTGGVWRQDLDVTFNKMQRPYARESELIAKLVAVAPLSLGSNPGHSHRSHSLREGWLLSKLSKGGTSCFRSSTLIPNVTVRLFGGLTRVSCV
jgi:hypothetical protein